MVSTFGVVFDPDLGRFDWTKFRAMARLHKKTDESLHKYLCAFIAMCRRVCRLPAIEGGQCHKHLSMLNLVCRQSANTLYCTHSSSVFVCSPLRYDGLFSCYTTNHRGACLPYLIQSRVAAEDKRTGVASPAAL